MKSKGPSREQVAAVRKVINDKRRTEKLQEAANNLTVLMNLNAAAELSATDVRTPAGSGPQWYYPDGSGLDANVIHAADCCDTIAALALGLQRALAQVDFPSEDKTHLSTALSAEAASWTARGALWRAGSAPSDPTAAAATIQAHVNACVTARRKVNPIYFEPES